MALSFVVVDTDLVIDFLRGHAPRAGYVRRLISERRFRVTAVTAFELRLGTDFHDRHEDIMRLLASRTLPLDRIAALQAGAIHSELMARGSTIGLADVLIAGICMRFGLPLATGNARHFQRIGSLELEPVAHE